MNALWIVLMITGGFVAAEYILYRMVFCHPLKKRPDAHIIPESRIYKAYRDIKLEQVREMGSIF